MRYGPGKRLLIRGFGVRLPGGAPVTKALTWHFVPDRSFFMSTLDAVCSWCALEPVDSFGTARTGRMERDVGIESESVSGLATLSGGTASRSAVDRNGEVLRDVRQYIETVR